MTRLLTLDQLVTHLPQRLVMQWVHDAATGRPVARWVSAPRLPELPEDATSGDFLSKAAV